VLTTDWLTSKKLGSSTISSGWSAQCLSLLPRQALLTDACHGCLSPTCALKANAAVRDLGVSACVNRGAATLGEERGEARGELLGKARGEYLGDGFGVGLGDAAWRPRTQLRPSVAKAGA